ncbi:MAG TPA: hypothetical protein VN729_12155 [Ktedonobacteraceae bacterium]|nr:hypothetical protein [Ktedonobacteraceae bacterium]
MHSHPTSLGMLISAVTRECSDAACPRRVHHTQFPLGDDDAGKQRRYIHHKVS